MGTPVGDCDTDGRADPTPVGTKVGTLDGPKVVGVSVGD